MSWESEMSDEQKMRLTFLNEYARFQNQKGQYLAMNEEKKLYFEGGRDGDKIFFGLKEIFLVKRNFFGPCLFFSSPISFSTLTLSEREVTIKSFSTTPPPETF